MTSNEKPAKSAKLNSNRHRKRVRKSIDKKKQNAVKKNQERYGDVSGGSKVVQRYKSDIVRAPAYRAERLTKGGYHSTFPVMDHVDKVKSLEQQIQSALSAQANIDVFTNLYKQVDNGQIANASDEQKESIARLKVLQEVNKYKHQREEAENESLRLANEIGADAFQDGKKQTVKSRAQLENLLFKTQREQKNDLDKQKVLQEILVQKSERKKIRKQNNDLKRSLVDEINDMHKARPGETADEKKEREEQKVKDKELFETNPTLFHEELVKRGNELLKQNKELSLMKDEIKSLNTSIKTMYDRQREIESISREDPRLVKDMTDILQSKGSINTMLTRMKDLVQKYKQKNDKYQNDYNEHKKRLIEHAERWREIDDNMEQLRQKMVTKLRKDKYWYYVPEDDGDRLDVYSHNELLEVWDRVLDGYKYENKEKTDKITQDIGLARQQIEWYNGESIKRRFMNKRLEEIDAVYRDEADPSEFMDDIEELDESWDY